MLKLLKLIVTISLIMALGYAYRHYTKTLLLSKGSLDESSLPWMQNLEEAMLLSKKEGKGVILDFWADWCGPCHELDEITYADPKIAARLKKSFVLAKLDVSKPTHYTNERQQKYDVSALPTVIFLDSNGKKLPSTSFTGFVDSDEMSDILDKVESQLNEHGQCVSC